MKSTYSLNSKIILLTGGTGSFGTAFIKLLLSNKNFKGTIRIFSRNESKQLALREQFNNDKRLRFLIGDVRQLDRVLLAMRGVDIVIHAAALRQLSALEYNPFEAVNTNIIGAQHVIRAAMETEVEKAMLVSSSNACSLDDLGGVTQSTAEKLFIQSNAYTNQKPKLSVVRYNNALDNFDNFIPQLKRQMTSKKISLPDKELSRFWVTAKSGAEFVIEMISEMKGGEILVPKLSSVKILDIAKAIAPKYPIYYTKLSPGDKLSDTLISREEMQRTMEFRRYFLIQPNFNFWSNVKNKNNPLPNPDLYTSQTNNLWLSPKQLRANLANL